jgi:AmmeMemoRadiSam system protein B
MVREPAVGGQFYEATFDKLNKQIEECYFSKFGPGDLPVKRSEKKNVVGVISPHAGYVFSGPCAAWVHKEIAEAKFPKTFILLGPNHFGFGSGMSIEDWTTPFGIVKTDKDLIIAIKENTELKITEENHISEHSLEVQLPFIQYSNKDKIADIRIVPIVIGRDLDFDSLSKKLYSVIKKVNKRVSFIISSDFTHYGRNYHYVPFSSDVANRIIELDKGAIELILKQDVNGFREYLNKTGITICGYMPILLFLAMTKYMEERPKAELLMHYTSGDIIGDYKNSVSYASVVFR